MLKKVTAFIMRYPEEKEILILRHPFGGCQFPAGTVEIRERPEKAVIREAYEETGLNNLTIQADLGHIDTVFPEDKAALVAPTKVYSRPDPSSFDWIDLKHGFWFKVHRKESGYTQISWTEPDKLPDTDYITYQFKGWVPDEVLSQVQRRFFYLLRFEEETPESWDVHADYHRYKLSWQPVDNITELIHQQSDWFDVIKRHLSLT